MEIWMSGELDSVMADISLVRAKVSQDMKNVFGIGADLAGDFLRTLIGVITNIFHAGLQFEDARGGFLAGFDTRLMIGVDLNERGIEPDGAFVEPNQRSDIKRVHFRNRDRDRFPPALVKRGARSPQKSLEIIAARHA